MDEATKEQLATLLVQSRERELAAAFAEQREPRLRYPAIEIEEVDGAITSFTFTAEVPNAPVPPGAFHFTPPKGMPVIDALPPV